MLTRQDREWFDRMEALPAEQREAITRIGLAISAELRGLGINPANDDRAASLDAALARYLIESQAPAPQVKPWPLPELLRNLGAI
jgi:hypothetical protein